MAARKRTLLVVDDPVPADGERAALKPDTNPALQGSGELDYVCGGCGTVLAQSIWPNVVFDLGIICSVCGAFNDSPSAIGRTAFGVVVYIPVGTYRLTSAVAVKEYVPMIGEAFPGAGPPAAGNIVSFPT